MPDSTLASHLDGPGEPENDTFRARGLRLRAKGVVASAIGSTPVLFLEGVDYQNYRAIYESGGVPGTDPAFYALFALTSVFGLGFFAFKILFWIISSLSISYWVLARAGNSFTLSLLSALVFTLGLAISFPRQAFSILWLLIALSLPSGRRVIAYFPALIALFSHVSVLVFYPLFAIKQEMFNLSSKRTWIGLSVLGLSTIVSLVFVSEILDSVLRVSLLTQRYSWAQAEAGAVLERCVLLMILSATLTLMSLWGGRVSKKSFLVFSYFNLLSVLCLIGVFVMSGGWLLTINRFAWGGVILATLYIVSQSTEKRSLHALAKSLAIILVLCIEFYWIVGAENQFTIRFF